MKFIKHIIAAALILAAVMPLTAKEKNKVQTVYMFGFAASFNDTIVHFTEIQAVDSVWLSSKNKFLLGRDNYSFQLRDYLTTQQLPYRTCVIFYDRKLSRIQKKFLKMKKLYSYTKKGTPTGNEIRTIAQNDFRFRPIFMGETTEEVTPAPQEKKSKEKKAKNNQPKKPSKE